MQLPRASTSTARSSTRSPPTSSAWGTHPSWSRLLGSPVLYEQIEDAADRAARLRGLARAADDHAHPHVGDPAARGLGHDLPRRARAQDDLRRLPGRALARRGGPPLPLRGSRTTSTSCCAPSADRTRLVCMDGVNSMTGNAPDLRAFAEVARRHGALLYVDDAHGFGVIGERAAGRALALRACAATASSAMPARRYDGIVLVGGLLEGVLVAAGVHRLPDRGQAAAQGRGAAVPVLGPVAGRLARHGARRLRRQRASRRRAAGGAARAHRARARRRSTGSTSRRRTARACRSSRSRCAHHDAHRRGRPLPVRARRLRDARRLPARARRTRSASASS